MPDTAQLDLEDWLKAHPVERNFKAPGTSARAAHAASKYAGKTFQAILKALSERPMTPDEVAEATGIHFLTTRPRCADLRRPRDREGRPIAPFVTPTGIRRENLSGREADVLRVCSEQERREWADAR